MPFQTTSGEFGTPSGQGGGGGGGSFSLTIDAVVTTATSNITANHYTPVDTTTQAWTGTLPNAPPDKTLAGAKIVILGAGHTGTIQCAGSDVINIPGGVTTYTLTLVNQGVLFEYRSATGVWTAIANDLELAQLDGRYLLLTGGTMSGAIAMGSNKITGLSIATNPADAVALSQLPAAVPELSALTAWGHSYLAGGTVQPTAENIGLMSRLLSAFHVPEPNFIPMVSGGNTVLVPSGPSVGSWDTVFQKVLPPTAVGLIAESGGVIGAPQLQWPLSGGPTFIGLNGFNDFAFSYQLFGIFNAFNFGVALSFNATYTATVGTVTCTGSNVTTSGTFLPNRVGGAGVQVGDFISSVGIRGFAKVSAVSFTGGNTVISVPAAQVITTEGSPTACFLIPSRSTTGQAVVGLQNAFQGVIERAIAGALFRSDAVSLGTNGEAGISYQNVGGTWSGNVSTLAANTYFGAIGSTGNTTRMTSGNTDTFTFTLPPQFPGGVVAVVFTGPVTSDLDNSGATVTWGSSSAPGATGTAATAISGQGWVGQPVPVVQRFLLTAADAGQTIIGTFAHGTPCNYTVSTVLNSTTTATGTFTNITPGMGVSGTDVPAGTFVQSVNGTSTSLVLSQAATGSTTTNLTYTSTVMQLDHISFEGNYISPVLLANQPPNGPGAIFSPNCSNILTKAITQAIATFTGTNSGSGVQIPGAPTGSVNNYSSIGLVDVVTTMSKRSFWLGTTLTAAGVSSGWNSSTVSTASITLIGQRTTTQNDQSPPFIGQFVAIPAANEGDVNEVCLITAVASTTNATLTGGTPPNGVYPAWTVTLLRGLQNYSNTSGYFSGFYNTSMAATGSTTAPTQQVNDLSWTTPTDMVHPGITGAALYASAFLQGYDTFANQSPDWIAAANSQWAFNRTRTVPRPVNNGYTYHRGTTGSLGGSGNLAKSVWCQRFVFPETVVIDQIGCHVATLFNGLFMYAGIFLPNGNGSVPSTTILTDFALASVNCSSSNANTYVSGYQVCPPGEYWIAIAFSNAGSTTPRVSGTSTLVSDFPWPMTGTPDVTAQILGYTGVPTASGTTTLTSIAPTTGWSAQTTTFPTIIVHHYSHTYLYGS